MSNNAKQQPASMLRSSVMGLFDGLYLSLWCLGFSAMLFNGSLKAWLPVGLAVLLLGTGLFAIFITLTSRASLQLTGTSRVAVVVLAPVTMALAGQQAGEPGVAGLATVLFLMALTSALLALGMLLVARLGWSRILELLPHPVLCGLMASVVWLLLDTGVQVTVGQEISAQLPQILAEGQNTGLLLFALLGAVFLGLLASRLKAFWVIPLGAIAIVIAFYGINGADPAGRAALAMDGWLFPAAEAHFGLFNSLQEISFSDVDFRFVLHALPELLIIIFLVLLLTSLGISRLAARLDEDLDVSAELRRLGWGNLVCAAVLSMPGASQSYRTWRYHLSGIRKPLMPLVSAAVCIGLIFFIEPLLHWVPWVLVGTIVFYITYRFIDDWLFAYIRSFQPADFLIAGMILAVTVFVGFRAGFLAGMVLTALLFILRYSMIPAVQSRFSLREYRSSVERPAGVSKLLDQYGDEAQIYTLRGFLFFGTANSIRERIRQDLERTAGRCKGLLLDFKRVTGVDQSALDALQQIRAHCDDLGVHLLLSSVPVDIELKMLATGGLVPVSGKPLFFDDLDFASEYLEEALLKRHQQTAPPASIREHLDDVLDSEARIDLLMHALKRVEVTEGEVLFHQGDADNGFYILEQGVMSAWVEAGDVRHRVKKFGPGSLIGEMSMFIPDHQRTATIEADVDCVLYYMSSVVMSDIDLRESRLAGAIYELMARTLGARVNYMNQRLLLELE